MIIGDDAIKAGGSGETGEGAGYLRSLQESVSVAEMDNPSAIYLALEYAMASANKELTKAILKVNADKIDKTTLFEDYISIRVEVNPELALKTAAERMGIDEKMFEARL